MNGDLTMEKVMGSESLRLSRLTGAAMLTLGLLVCLLALPDGFWSSAMTAAISLSPEKLRYLGFVLSILAAVPMFVLGMSFAPRQTKGFVLGGAAVLGVLVPLTGWLLLFGFDIASMQAVPGAPLMGVASLLAVGGLTALLGSIMVPERRREGMKVILCIMLFAVGTITALAFEHRMSETQTMVSAGDSD